jgi:hypothetical protein
MKIARMVPLGFVALSLWGCAVVPRPEVEAPGEPAAVIDVVPDPASELERLLDYFQRIRNLSGAQLAQEHHNARFAFARTGSDFDRVRLAMVLSLPNTGFNDESRTLDLLEPMVKSRNSTLNGLASLMSAYLQEQRRLGQSVQGMQQNMESMQQNMQSMQQKLDALRSMERSLIEREQAGQKRR